MNALAHTLAKVYINKPRVTLCDVKALAPVDELAYMLAGKEKKKYAVSPVEM